MATPWTCWKTGPPEACNSTGRRLAIARLTAGDDTKQKLETRMSKLSFAGLLVAGVLAASQTALAADALDGLAADAEKNGTIVWYESSPNDQIDKVIAAFTKRYPKLKVEHMRDTGGNSIAARVIQEVQGGGRPPDVATGGMSAGNPLRKRGLLETVDWAALGVNKAVPQSPTALLTASVFYVFIYNTNMVKAADAPKTWDDLLDPKWKGKIGTWTRPMALVSLEASWGQPKTQQFAGKFKDQNPFYQKSTFTLAQQVASGETSIALGLYHSTLPAKEKGAPIAINLPDPVAISQVYSVVIAKGKNVKGGELLAAWLATPEGAKAYEDATGRGNEAVPGTKTFDLLSKHTLTHYSLDQADDENASATRFEKILR
jgi:iron(III) transport system substrate-binding protein